MSKNLGSLDRIIRLAIGVAAILFALFGSASGTIVTLAWLIGIIMIATSAISFCPLYRIVGLNSCKDCQDGD